MPASSGRGRSNNRSPGRRHSQSPDPFEFVGGLGQGEGKRVGPEGLGGGVHERKGGGKGGGKEVEGKGGIEDVWGWDLGEVSLRAVGGVGGEEGERGVQKEVGRST